MNKEPALKVSIEERVDILKTVEIFSSVDEKMLTEIAVELNEIDLYPKQTLFHKGDKGNTMYIIVSGIIQIHDGDYIFDLLQKGQVFGEYSILDEEVRSASVSGVTHSLLLELKQDIFYRIMMKHVSIIRRLLSVLIKRARRQNELEEKIFEGNRIIQRKNQQLDVEKQKSDTLLFNILPGEIAKELMLNGRSEARSYNLVTVLFADFKGFTRSSEQMLATDIVKHLEYYFTAFDEIMEKYKLEKIKTIGDAYMAAGGIPQPNKRNPVDMVCAALEMQHFMHQCKEDQAGDSDLIWELRVGINTGPLVAGVIGKKKFAYDVWGDTVNIASRMESSGEINKINISEPTYQLIKDYFKCKSRGEIYVKGKGIMNMYFVENLRAEFSRDSTGFRPTQAFLDSI
ncbi:MAG TPA: adenylate cyclase [Microscillaceae bacterium]|nr:adenylate cyclase [Microscillaceae bacterium]